MLTTETKERRFHNENVIVPLLFFSLLPSLAFLFAHIEGAPVEDKLMYLRCGNQILKSLPSSSSAFFSYFSLNPTSPSPLLPVLLSSVIEFNGAQGGCDRWGGKNWSYLDRSVFFTDHILCQMYFHAFTVPWILQKTHHSSFLHTFPPTWTLASHSCLATCER